jgi:hypothetical protein
VAWFVLGQALHWRLPTASCRMSLVSGLSPVHVWRSCVVLSLAGSVFWERAVFMLNLVVRGVGYWLFQNTGDPTAAVTGATLTAQILTLTAQILTLTTCCLYFSHAQ